MSASFEVSKVVSYVLLAVALVGCETGPAGPSATLEISGRIEADETHLAAQIGGRVSAVEVREGDAVKAGQVLVRCSSEQALAMNDQSNAMVEATRRQVQQARTLLPLLDEKYRQLELRQDQSVLDASGRVAAGEGQLAAARADLARARSELSQVTADASTYKALADKGAVPAQAADQLATKQSTLEAIVDAAGRQVAAAEGGLSVANAAKSNPEIISLEKAALKHQMAEARAAIRSAESQIAVAEAVVAQTSAAVSELTITAPYDGIVLTRSVEPGQVIAPGQTLLTLLDPRAIYLRAYVPEGQIGRVVVGQRAEVVLDSDLDSPLEAKVSRVDPEAMFTPENTYFREDRVKQVVGVKLLLSEGLGRAKVGMPADGRIFVEESTSAQEISKP
jgi:HlyD family secretion protein